MNVDISYHDLPPAQRKVVHLYAWGLTAKEIANNLKKSESTIKNQLNCIFKKIGIHKDTELTAWYFCTRFRISLDFSPIHQAITSIVLLMVLGIGAIDNDNPFTRVRTRNARTARSARARGRSRRNNLDYMYEY